MAVQFHGTMDSQNHLEMNDPFFRNDWQTGDLLRITKNENGTILFEKVQAEVQITRVKYSQMALIRDEEI